MSPPEVPAALAEPVSDFLDHLSVERGASVHTVGAYRRDLGRYVAWLAGRGRSAPAEITEADVVAHVADLADPPPPGRALAPASVARGLASVRAFHRFLRSERIVSEDVTVQVSAPAQPSRLPKALGVAEVQRLLETVGAGEGPLALRDRALLELLYGTGARVSEITALDVDDVTPLLARDEHGARDDDLGLRLIGKGDKERWVPVGSYARDALEAWLVRGRPDLACRSASPSPALLLTVRGGRLSRQSAGLALSAAAERAGLAATVSPHTLRHSYATHLLDGGADVRVVQELLGHASVTTTQIYTRVTVDHLREVYLTAHPRAY